MATALVKGFVRDRTSLFFTILFPLMFLVLFGGLFNYDSSPRLQLVQVGQVGVVDDLPAGAKEVFDKTFEVERSDDLEVALDQVRKGDADAAIEMRDGSLVAHYTQTDQVRAAMTQGNLRAFVDAANVASSGQPPRYGFVTERVEDESLKAIQFVTPGLLGWAVAMSAAFGAAATLQGWRNSKLLRRLQLAPVPPAVVVAARVGVTVLIALVQMAIFLGLGIAAFGLELSGWWWVSVPLLVAGTLTFMAVGLLAGAIARTQEGAVNLANVMVLPMAFLSGSFFPLEGTPQWLQTISWALPLRHLNEGMLDLMVRGEGPSAALLPLVILLGFTVVLTALAARLFRWDDA
jgi:ABC-2 type transport system permease protein